MKVPGTLIEVDDFRPTDGTLHVLTHYHADHRKGLEPGEDRPIVCSSITRRLLNALHRVPSSSLTALDPGDELSLGGDVTVRAYDANHCPGALMLLFDVAGRRILHTGDFRYCAEHDRHPELFDDIDTLMLDCTYEADGETFDHPPLEDAIEQVLALIEANPDKIVNVGVYMVGKNRLIQAIAERFDTRVWLPPKYHRIYRLLGMDGCVTQSRKGTRMRGLPMGYLRRHYQTHNPGWHRHSIVILPTGWTGGFGDGPAWHYVPYSEHNSSAELRAFIDKVSPREIVNTNDFFPGPAPVEVAGRRPAGEADEAGA